MPNIKWSPLIALVLSLNAWADSALPKVIVNHDLYIHTGKPLETSPVNESTKSYTQDYASSQGALAAEQAINAIADNQREITSFGAAFSLNATYGQHQLWYWKSPNTRSFPTYRSWVERGLMGNAAGSYYLQNGYFDSLLIQKLNGKDIFSSILAKTSKDRPTIISVRLNDHHHTIGAADIFSGNVTDAEIASAKFSRRVAALSPEYRNFYRDSRNLVSKQNGFGAGCRLDSKQLNFAEPDVILSKQREILNLVNSYFDSIDGIELDFLRNNCFFTNSTPLHVREKRMHENLIKPIQALIAQLSNKPPRKKFHLILRLPLDEVNELPKHGINLRRLASEGAIDGIIFAYSQPYTSSQVVPNPLRRFTQFKGKVYYELYNISDSQGVGAKSFRRPSALNEIATTAYEALYAGYDGLSLFNFHYIFKDNANVLNSQNYFSWPRLFSFIDDTAALKAIPPRFFFAQKNAAGPGNKFATSGLNKPVRADFRFHPEGRALASQASLRLILEGFENLSIGEQAAWKNIKFHLKVNGKLVTVKGSPLVLVGSTSTSPGWAADPASDYELASVVPWGFYASKEGRFPQPKWNALSQSIEVIPVSDPGKLLQKTRKVQFQLAL